LEGRNGVSIGGATKLRQDHFRERYIGMNNH